MADAAAPLRLVVLFGGRSAEHDVSCVTAVSVLSALDPGRYEVVPVGITTEGDWVLAEDARLLVADGRAADLPPALEARGPRLEPFSAMAGAVVLPLLHGPFGEDGTVQGACELAGVPYVGSGVLGSAVAMDKLTAKRLMGAAGLAGPRYLGLRGPNAVDLDSLARRVEDELGWPVFVKPSNLGSSIGVSKAGDPLELAAAVQEALGYDEWVIVEEAISGAREIECGVLGDLAPEASRPGEVRPSREFYDYRDKYEPDRAELLVPAPLSVEVSDEVRRLALRAFAAVRAEGMARVDFFYDEGRQGLLVNEVNTIPGFTPISMYPKMWEASGIGYSDLIEHLVDAALERHHTRAERIGRMGRAG